MKKIIYLSAVLLSWFYGRHIFTFILSPFEPLFLNVGIKPLYLLIFYICYGLTYLCAAYRLLVILKNRSLLIPTELNGILYFSCVISVILGFIGIFGIYIMNATTFLVDATPQFARQMKNIAGCFAIIPVVYYEFREFYKLIPEQEKK